MTQSPISLLISLIPLFVLTVFLVLSVWFMIAVVRYTKSKRQISWGSLACELYDRGKLSEAQFEAVCEELRTTHRVPHIGATGDQTAIRR